MGCTKRDHASTDLGPWGLHPTYPCCCSLHPPVALCIWMSLPSPAASHALLLHWVQGSSLVHYVPPPAVSRTSPHALHHMVKLTLSSPGMSSPTAPHYTAPFRHEGCRVPQRSSFCPGLPYHLGRGKRGKLEGKGATAATAHLATSFLIPGQPPGMKLEDGALSFACGAAQYLEIWWWDVWWLLRLPEPQ